MFTEYLVNYGKLPIISMQQYLSGDYYYYETYLYSLVFNDPDDNRYWDIVTDDYGNFYATKIEDEYLKIDSDF